MHGGWVGDTLKNWTRREIYMCTEISTSSNLWGLAIHVGWVLLKHLEPFVLPHDLMKLVM